MNTADEYVLTDMQSGEQVPYKIIRSKRKSYGIVIDEKGGIMVRIPMYGSILTARRFAEERKEWIFEKRALQKKRYAQKESDITDPQREGLEKRYRVAAKEYFAKRVAYYAQILDVAYGKIRIADQKTRWGSCSSNKTLSFNWRLMLAPPGVLDYVVVHELCHLKEMNHSPKFWRLVEEILPEYKEYRKWLKENGNTLHL